MILPSDITTRACSTAFACSRRFLPQAQSFPFGNRVISASEREKEMDSRYVRYVGPNDSRGKNSGRIRGCHTAEAESSRPGQPPSPRDPSCVCLGQLVKLDLIVLSGIRLFLLPETSFHPTSPQRQCLSSFPSRPLRTVR